MTCRDCIYYSGCSGILNDFGMRLNPAREVCDRFKARSRFVELPYELVSKKDLIRELSAQRAVNKVDLKTALDILKNLPYIRIEAEAALKERSDDKQWN